MSKNHRSQSEPRIFAVVHKTAGMWRVLIAQNGDGLVHVREARSFSDVTDTATLDSYLEGQRVESVIAVLPASSVVCRTCTLPDVESAALEQALSLQAETYLLGTAETHRLATAVLPIAPGEASRTGIIVSWPERATADAPPLSLPVTYAPDIAALAALLNGHRPADPLIWVDRKTGAVAVALTHAAGAVLRATREHADSREAWLKNATRVLAETALSVGHGAGFVESLAHGHASRLAEVTDEGSAFIVPREIIESAAGQIEGTESDEAWWSQYGIAAGVAIAATGELAPLTTLVSTVAVETPSRLEAVVQTLSRPRTALITCILCLLAIAFLPLLVSGARLALLNSRYADIEQRTAEIGKTESRLAMYKALEKQTWSMTKILADIVSNTPRGIELESIRLQHSDESVAVSGQSKGHDGQTATELIATMQEMMRESRLFGEIKLNWDEPNNFGHHEFELSAKITAPHRRVRYATELDFAKWTLAAREANRPPPDDDADSDPSGDDGVPEDALAQADRDFSSEDPDDDRRTDAAPSRSRGRGDDDRTSDPGTSRNRAKPGGTEDRGIDPGSTAATKDDGPGAGSRSSRPDRSRPTGPGSAAPDAGDRGDIGDRVETGPALGTIPAPLTEQQIAAMSLEEVTASLVEVARAKMRVDRDDEPDLHARLSREFELLMKRKREAN